MSPRTLTELALLERQLGTDMLLDFAGPGGFWEDGDLAVASDEDQIGIPIDLDRATGIPAAVQFLVNRLKTQTGELASLGHPTYGSRHHELIGQPNNQRTRNLIKVYVLEALAQEPRIDSILQANVYATHSPPRDTVQIDLTIQLIGQPNPLNFVVPFSLEVGA